MRESRHRKHDGGKIMAETITTHLSYIEFDGKNFEEVERFLDAKIEEAQKDPFEPQDEHKYYASFNGKDSRILFGERQAFAKIGDVLYPITFSSVTNLLKHFKVNEMRSQQVDNNSNKPIFTDEMPFVKPINIGNELERILSIFRSRKIDLSDINKYEKEKELDTTALYNFNVGLLCGIKLAERNR